MKKIIVVMLFSIALLTGCSSGNDFINQVAKNNNAGLKVYTDGPHSILWNYDEDNLVELDNEMLTFVIESMEQTELKSYIKSDAGLVVINSPEYLKDYVEHNKIKNITLEVEKSDYYNESFYTDKHWVVKDDIICLENNDGVIITNYAFVLLSKNNELKERLISGGYEDFYNKLKEIDDAYIRQVNENPSGYIGNNIVEMFNCCIDLSVIDISISTIYGTVSKTTEYLCDLYMGDGWVFDFGNSNESCDSVVMFYTDIAYDEINGEIAYNQPSNYMVMYGSDEELKEIELVLMKDTKEVAAECKPTIINCLGKMGFTDSDISAVVDNLPDKSGKTNDISYIVEYKTLGIYDYRIIKFFAE